MRDGRGVERAGGAVGEAAVDPARLDRRVRAEQRAHLRARAGGATGRGAPHERRELVVLAEHEAEVAREGGRSLGRTEHAGRRARHHHRCVAVGHGGGRDQHGPAAHRVTGEHHLITIDEREGAQVRQGVGPAETAREGGRIGVAVAGLVDGEHHVAAARELDRVGRLRLVAVDVAVDRDHAGHGRGVRGGARPVELAVHHPTVGHGEAHVPDRHRPEVALHQAGDEAAATDQEQGDDEQERVPSGSSIHDRSSRGP
jgi:hypothetical protein